MDSSPNLGAARNSTFFGLGHGLHRNNAMQAEWNQHGETTFEFEVLETLDEDVSPIVSRDLLKAKKSEWAAKLNAQPL